MNTGTELTAAPVLDDEDALGNAPAGYVSRPFYVLSTLIAQVAGTVLVGGALLAGSGRVEEEFLPVFLLGEAGAIYGLVVLLVLCYKMWAALPPAAARTTPGKAIGFMLIPLFNFYWAFQALWGWAQDFNRYAEQRDLSVPRVSEALVLSVCTLQAIGAILGWVGTLGGVPFLGMVIALPVLVLLPMFIFQACGALNALPRDVLQSAYNDRHAPGQIAGSRGLGTASLVVGILSIIVPYLGLVLGIVAIILSGRQRKRLPIGLATAGKVLGIIGVIWWGLVTALLMFFLASA